jgi:hypothetical protein
VDPLRPAPPGTLLVDKFFSTNRPTSNVCAHPNELDPEAPSPELPEFPLNDSTVTGPPDHHVAGDNLMDDMGLSYFLGNLACCSWELIHISVLILRSFHQPVQ